jgi:fucose 4-O-acetylase-like acetyltransferase
MNEEAAGGVHWSFWVIGAVALIWNALGSMNYIMQTSPGTLAGYPEAARTLVETRPAWATGAFAIAVFGGALGCVLLLLRRSVAFYLFIASLIGVIVTNIHTLGVPGSVEICVGSLISLVVAAFLFWYSRMIERKGWIR